MPTPGSQGKAIIRLKPTHSKRNVVEKRRIGRLDNIRYPSPKPRVNGKDRPEERSLHNGQSKASERLPKGSRTSTRRLHLQWMHFYRTDKYPALTHHAIPMPNHNPAISISKDIEALNLYIELEEQRHDFKFTHKIILPGQLVQKGYRIPPLLVQPYVENAILHGLRHKENGQGLLTITFEEKENQLICLVEDNGIGRKASALIYDQRKQQHQSMGLKVSNDRIESLNELFKTVSQVVIIDKEDGAGTIVKLIFPKIAESE